MKNIVSEERSISLLRQLFDQSGRTDISELEGQGSIDIRFSYGEKPAYICDAGLGSEKKCGSLREVSTTLANDLKKYSIPPASSLSIEDLPTETKNRIQKLNELWYAFVCIDHHKDRDCHFNLRLKFSEKESPKWLALHTGYIYDMAPEKFESLSEAANYLVKNIEKALIEGLDWKKFQVEEEAGMYGENRKEELKTLSEIRKGFEKYKAFFLKVHDLSR